MFRRYRLALWPRFRPGDWRIGVYGERGTLASEIGFLVIAPLPMMSVLVALYRRDGFD